MRRQKSKKIVLDIFSNSKKISIIFCIPKEIRKKKIGSVWDSADCNSS
jgi:hypothetical protein